MAGRIAYYGNIVTNGLVLDLDAAKRDSYPGSGTTWNNILDFQNNGTLTNGPTYSNLNAGSIVFDGVNDYVALGTFNGLGSTNRTISVWFKATSLPASSGRIITFPANDTSTDTPAFTMTLTSLGVLQCGFGGSPYNGYNSSISYTLNTWVNIVASITGNTMISYKNSVSLGSVTTTGTVSSNPIGYLGRYNGNYGQYVTGNISSIQLYNRALSAQEILQNYNATKTRYGL